MLVWVLFVLLCSGLAGLHPTDRFPAMDLDAVRVWQLNALPGAQSEEAHRGFECEVFCGVGSGGWCAVAIIPALQADLYQPRGANGRVMLIYRLL